MSPQCQHFTVSNCIYHFKIPIDIDVKCNCYFRFTYRVICFTLRLNLKRHKVYYRIDDGDDGDDEEESSNGSIKYMDANLSGRHCVDIEQLMNM